MKILVLNCGSSSIKYQLFNMASSAVLSKGLADKIGMKGSSIKHEKNTGQKIKLEGEILDHKCGIEYILGVITSPKHGCIKSLEEIDAVGHRIVHGGEKFNKSVLIDDEVIKGIENCNELAPLHNPANLKGVFAIKALLPAIPQIGVFDTAFHQTMPDHAFMYATPYSLYKKYGIRRYGFHGTSHDFISNRAAEMIGEDITKLKIITCHLGNGGSVAAIDGGKSVDTSMGLTPVEGLIMGTRAGDVDAGVLTYLMQKEEIGPNAINALVNKHSGVLGISGISSDMRDVENAAWNEGNKRADLALRMYSYRIRKYIGAYSAAMGGVDAVVFAGGVGENGPETREAICSNMEYLGLKFSSERNDGVRGKEAIISADDSRVKVLIVPTDEELVIARDTKTLADKFFAEKAKA